MSLIWRPLARSRGHEGRDLGFGQRLARVSSTASAPPGSCVRRAGDRVAGGRVARDDDLDSVMLRDDTLPCDIEPQNPPCGAPLSGPSGEAVLREDRPDVTVEFDAVRPLGPRRSDSPHRQDHPNQDEAGPPTAHGRSLRTSAGPAEAGGQVPPCELAGTVSLLDHPAARPATGWPDERSQTLAGQSGTAGQSGIGSVKESWVIVPACRERRVSHLAGCFFTF